MLTLQRGGLSSDERGMADGSCTRLLSPVLLFACDLDDLLHDCSGFAIRLLELVVSSRAVTQNNIPCDVLCAIASSTFCMTGRWPLRRWARGRLGARGSNSIRIPAENNQNVISTTFPTTLPYHSHF